MQTNFWVKTENFKVLGKTLFTKETICTDKSYEGNAYSVIVTPEYFKSEFEVKEDDNNRNR